MKTIRKIFYRGIICLMTVVLGACSNSEGELETLVDRVETSRATAVEAEIKDLTAGGLDAALEAAVGANNKYNVTKLKISGNYNAQDHMTLRKLTSLEDLDMAGVTIVADEENQEANRYQFQTVLWGNIQSINEVLSDNVIGYYMFAGITSLKKFVLPSSVTEIRGSALHTCSSLESVTLPSSLKIMREWIFVDSRLETITIPASLEEVNDYFIAGGNPVLKAVFWESNISVPACENVENVFVYVPNNDVIVSPVWKNVIRDGVAESIEIKAKTPWDEDWSSFVAPKAFTAKKISYSRYFNNWTGVEEAAGWETIVLPFVPTSITHESKGIIAPFNSGVEGAKSFWLRSLTADGFVDVTTMAANVPYIIAMPNTDRYLDDYRLNGWVTFSGENVNVPAEAAKPEAVSGPDFSLQPTYLPVEESNSIYSLNVRDGRGYNQGSAFIRGGGDVRAFEAYAVVGGRSTRSLIDLDCTSKNTRSAGAPNNSGIPQIGDM